jgi:type VI secretion system secreted protein VgrG
MQVTATLSMQDLPDDAQVVALEAREGLSQLYDVAIRFICAEADLDLEALLWTEAAVKLEDRDGSGSRLFHGIIEEAAALGELHELFAYRIRLRPWLSGLVTRARSRIFQDLSVVEAIEEVMKGSGIKAAKLEKKLARSYAKREYLSQWRESEREFVLRLLEDEGIFFSFNHADDGHVLVLEDDASSRQPIDGEASLPFHAFFDRLVGAEIVTAVTVATRLVPTVATERDWDPRAPKAPREAVEKASSDAALEIVEDPAGFREPAEGSRRARDRLEALRWPKLVLSGETNSLRLRPGRFFDLTDIQPSGLQRRWRVVALSHHYVKDGFLAGESEQTRYRGRFECIPDDVPFRAPLTTPRPRIFGKESAVVVGPAGEEIHVDAWGRVKVHFYWDREGKIDDKASCWIRVQQLNTTGTMVLPRVGWEVAVGFLHGDPDRPIVLEKLYNRETMPPYALPDNLHSSSLQSSSSPGGGGTNEIRMSDGAGGMEFFVHAQRDYSLRVANNFTEEIQVDSSEQVTSDATLHVDQDEKTEVGGNRAESVTGGWTNETVGKRNVQVGAVDQWGVGALHTVRVGGDRTDNIGGVQTVLANQVTETVNGDYQRTVGAAVTFASAGPMVEAVAGKKVESIGGAKVELIRKARAESVGSNKVLTAALVRLKTGKDLSVSAASDMAMTVGGPLSITCDKDFALSGQSVTFILGKATLDAGAKLELTPGSAKLNADSITDTALVVELKGQINYRSG